MAGDSEVMLIDSAETRVDGNPEELVHSQQLSQGPRVSGWGLTVREQQQQSQHRGPIPAERREEGGAKDKHGDRS